MNNELDKELVDKSDKIAGALNGLSGFNHHNQYQSMMEYLRGSLQRSITERAAYFNELSKFRDNYIVNGIYDIIGNDVFIDTGSSDFISLECGDKEVQEELQELFKHLNIPTLMMSILPDLLHYGSYPLRPITEEGKGITAIRDDLEPASTIAVCDTSNYPLFYFIDETIKLRNDARYIDQNTRNRFKYFSIKEITFFSLDLDFIKLQLPAKAFSQLKNKLAKVDEETNLLPESLKIKTSKSFIYGSLDKLKEALLLDKVSVYRDLAQLLSPNLVGIPVPDIYDPTQLIDIVQKYDTLLNSDIAKLNGNMDFNFSMADIARMKVIPVAGDRSSPHLIDTGAKETITDPERLNSTLEKLLNSLGIPVELFFGNSDAKTNLKTNVRYAKKIKRIQKNISKALTYLCLLHLSIKYPDREIYAEDINIQLKNNINIDELENLEAQDLVISSVSSMFELFEKLKPTIVAADKYDLNVNEFVKAVKDGLSTIGSPYQNVIRNAEHNDGAQDTGTSQLKREEYVNHAFEGEEDQ